DMGRRIERTLNTLTVLKTALAPDQEIEINSMLVWLELFDCSMTYRSRYLDDVQFGTVIDLILLDETNPRSVSFQVAQLSSHIDALPNSQNRSLRTMEQRIALSSLTKLRLFDLDALAAMPPGATNSILELIDLLEHDVLALSDALSIAYFSHAAQPRLLARQQDVTAKGGKK
ncbi:alpha-E domain-containing protein, partial [bacterium]|nr:alpha-E domain-containing protein [bacterium]